MRKLLNACICFIFALAAFSMSGCLGFNETYKSGKRFYNTHINRPSTFSTDDAVVLESGKRGLVQRVMNIDMELTKLEKALDALAMPPDGNDAAEFLRRFPWLSGLAMVSPDGELGASIPAAPLKNLDYAPLLQLAPKALPRDLRCSIQDTPLGPEIIIARPFLQENNLVVILAATFDFRALLPFAGTPDDLVVRSADVLLWSGNRDYASTPLAAIDWSRELKSNSDGIASGKDMAPMIWITRYIGGVPVIFASDAAKD
ncbi:MAG: hypothetical protein MJ061_01495 [Mailhella sp.]|nr:hypothetical protein [Mailhella sp.]